MLRDFKIQGSKSSKYFKPHFIPLPNLPRYFIRVIVTFDSSCALRVIKDEYRHLKSVYSFFFCTEPKKKYVLIS